MAVQYREVVISSDVITFTDFDTSWSRIYTLDSTSELLFFFFSSRRRHTRLQGDWSSDVCSSDLAGIAAQEGGHARGGGAAPCALPPGADLAGRPGAVRRHPCARGAAHRGGGAEIGRASCRERV